MAKSYPINPNFGIILTDSGNIIAMTDEDPSIRATERSSSSSLWPQLWRSAISKASSTG